MVNSEDNRLVAECLEGNLKAFEQLVEKYQKPIFNNALRLTGNEDDAKDLTQTVFVKAFEKLKDFKPEYKFFSWIYRMMVNESINVFNHRQRQQPLNGAIISSEKNPEQLLENAELEAHIQDALMELSVDYRIAVVLRHFADLSYRDIAYVSNITEKTVKSRLFTARRKLGEILKRQGIVTHD
jgi:RNA polymerase sigma-70 factor (ECF subfamily)